MRITLGPSPSLYLFKGGESTKKCSVPDYLGALLGVRGDDLEKQFHCSVNSQHGSCGDWEKQKHSSYWPIWTKHYFQHHRLSLKERWGPLPFLPQATLSWESLWSFIPGLEVKDTWKALIIFPSYLFLKGWQSHEITFFIFQWPIALHHCIRGAGGIVTLQCCVGFYSTAKWISHTYTYIPSSLDFLPI